MCVHTWKLERIETFSTLLQLGIRPLPLGLTTKRISQPAVNSCNRTFLALENSLLHFRGNFFTVADRLFCSCQRFELLKRQTLVKNHTRIVDSLKELGGEIVNRHKLMEWKMIL